MRTLGFIVIALAVALIMSGCASSGRTGGGGLIGYSDSREVNSYLDAQLAYAMEFYSHYPDGALPRRATVSPPIREALQRTSSVVKERRQQLVQRQRQLVGRSGSASNTIGGVLIHGRDPRTPETEIQRRRVELFERHGLPTTMPELW